jgi:hypothetical protein
MEASNAVAARALIATEAGIPLDTIMTKATSDHLARIGRGRSGDLPLVLELKFQFFNELGQSFSRKRIGGLQGQPMSLLQLPLQFLTLRPGHFSAPAN